MKSTYARAMRGIRISEGGYSNHPRDPGGATNYGITQRVYDEYRSSKKAAKQSVRLISEAEVNEIYKTRYADKVKYDDLPAGIDYATLDGAINSGVSRGAKWLQSALGVSSDGKIGTQTISAAAKVDAIATVKSMCAKRMSFLRGLSIFSTFGKGWTARVARVEAESVSMAMEARGISAKSLPIALKTEADHAAASSKAAKNSATASGAGAAGSAGAATQTMDWSNLAGLEGILLIGATAALVVLAIYLIHRSRVNTERAAAYAAVAAGASA
ncbi:glycoside hydrolase family 108 protein [Rhizobium lentis]|uniref:glycoside hydrolase family 108 protein n=1 Tax=Rhizobium lentis TaxID=1138194 RepID=UPI001C83F5B7|nr:glycosyl hydrolase 108 family protein [Rhizobium lentis]MBX5111945.1 glycoside hydrolase family 108 protein [Rhizobium lentis]